MTLDNFADHDDFECNLNKKDVNYQKN